MQLERSFLRILDFYGLQMDSKTLMIKRGQNFNERAGVWLTRNNHNFLRITRVIHSLGLLGLPNHSQALSTIMQDIAQNEGKNIINETNLKYWKEACVK